MRLAMGDRVVVMADGRIMQTGDPEEVYAQPACRFVAGFIGHPPMNFLPATVEQNGTGVEVRRQMGSPSRVLGIDWGPGLGRRQRDARRATP